MNRKSLCTLLLANIHSNSSDSLIISHARLVLEQVELAIKDRFCGTGLSTDSIENRNLLAFSDIAEAIRDIAEHELCNAMTRIWDFLLRGKDYDNELGVYELYIVQSLLKGLVLANPSNPKFG